MKLTGTNRRTDGQDHILSQADALTKTILLRQLDCLPYYLFFPNSKSLSLLAAHNVSKIVNLFHPASNDL